MYKYTKDFKKIASWKSLKSEKQFMRLKRVSQDYVILRSVQDTCLENVRAISFIEQLPSEKFQN